MILSLVSKHLTLEPAAEKAFRNALSFHVGHTVVIPEIKRYRKPRSQQQLKTVMGMYMDRILEELGYEETDKDYVYNQLKVEMGWTEFRVSKKNGEMLEVPRKTRNLNKEEYSKFMESFVRHMAVNHNIILPDPISGLATI